MVVYWPHEPPLVQIRICAPLRHLIRAIFPRTARPLFCPASEAFEPGTNCFPQFNYAALARNLLGRGLRQLGVVAQRIEQDLANDRELTRVAQLETPEARLLS